MGFYDYSVLNRAGEEVSMRNFEGKVVLVVNTATGCGFTPHYEALQKMYDKYAEKGLVILDIPCNQFWDQAPESDDDIHKFCTLNYNTKFDQMKKSDVNGENELPLYTYLKSQKGFEGFGDGELAEKMDEILESIDADYKNNANIKWNFTKFVVDRKGEVVARLEPTASLDNLEKCVASLL